MNQQPFSDEKVAFLFHVYQEFELAERLVSQLRFFFPLSNILGIADGTYSYSFNEFAWQHNVKYIEGDRLFYQRTSNEWIKRMFWFYLVSSRSSYLIKIDPDSYVLRRFNYLPSFDIAGSVYKISDKISFIHGGCTLYSREACRKIKDSPLLDSPEYLTSPNYRYRRFQPPYKHESEVVEQGYFTCEDRIVGDLAPKLDLKLGVWDEVDADMYEKNPKDYADTRRAVIHAVKKLIP